MATQNQKQKNVIIYISLSKYKEHINELKDPSYFLLQENDFYILQDTNNIDIVSRIQLDKKNNS